MNLFNFIQSLFGASNTNSPTGTDNLNNINTINQDNLDDLIDASWSGYSMK